MSSDNHCSHDRYADEEPLRPVAAFLPVMAAALLAVCLSMDPASAKQADKEGHTPNEAAVPASSPAPDEPAAGDASDHQGSSTLGASVAGDSDDEASPRPRSTTRDGAKRSVASSPERRSQRSSRRREVTVSGSQLAELGFFQDFEELSLDALLDPDVLEVTTSLASRREQPLEDAPGAVCVLTSSEIVNLGVRSLEQLLDTLPGFDVITDSLGRPRLIARGVPTGGMGGLSENVLVMINGHRLNEAISGGATTLNLTIPVSHVKKVEVLRGPATVLYGGGALAAVINILTEEPGEAKGILVGSGLGSHWTHQQSLKLGNSLREIDVAASLILGGSSGAQLLVPADAQSLWDRRGASFGRSPISLAPRRTDDDYSNLDTLYRIAYRNFEIDWRAHQQRAGSFIGYANTFGQDDSQFSKQMSFDLTYRRENESLGVLLGRLSLALNDRRELFEVIPPGFEGTHEDGRSFRFDSGIYLQTKFLSRRYAAEVVLLRDASPDHQLTAGVTLEREATHDLEALGNLAFTEVEPLPGLQPLPQAVPGASRNTLGIFVQDGWRPQPRLALTGGLRVDAISDVGVLLSPSLAAVMDLPRDLKLKLVYARGYRPPTLAEQSFNLPGFTGNPDLRAVSAQSLESILMLRRHNLRVSATAFANFVRNSIPSERPASSFDSPLLRNASGYDVFGIEVDGRINVGLNTFFTNYTYQEPRAVDGGSRVADLPTHLGTLGATVALGDRYSVSPLWRVRSARPRAPGDARRRVPAYGWIDLTFRVTRVYETLELTTTIQNVLDQPAFDPAPLDTVPNDYPRPGRRLFIQATYQF